MFLHVLAAMIWLGGILTLGVLATQVLRGGEPDAGDRGSKAGLA